MGPVALVSIMKPIREEASVKNWNISLLELSEDSETAVSTVIDRLHKSGMGAVRSFDLRSACAAYPDRSCPHHGKASCDCQLVILLVFDPLEQPATVMLHTYNGETQVGLAASPTQHPSARLENRLRRVLRQPKSPQPLTDLRT